MTNRSDGQFKKMTKVKNFKSLGLRQQYSDKCHNYNQSLLVIPTVISQLTCSWGIADLHFSKRKLLWAHLCIPIVYADIYFYLVPCLLFVNGQKSFLFQQAATFSFPGI